MDADDRLERPLKGAPERRRRVQEFSHCSLSYPVEFHVEPTGVADRLSLCVSSPQGGGGGVTVGAGQAHPPRGRLPQIKHVGRQWSDI